MANRYKAAPKYCAVCGKKLPNACQKYCIECLLKAYKYGADFQTRKVAFHRLNCRGYTVHQIWREIDERGV